jgi:hypothetical protein
MSKVACTRVGKEALGARKVHKGEPPTRWGVRERFLKVPLIDEFSAG